MINETINSTINSTNSSISTNINGGLNQIDMGGLFGTLHDIVLYVRTGSLNLANLLAKFIHFSPDAISMVLLIAGSLWLAGKVIDPRQNSNFWLLGSGALFYALYLW